ncbi:MAG TPA: tRNA uridine-5-carboxymethylaminomethyl(34) synthesis GTPase MnmE [Chloroflexia bacterium]|nr:tRNA uridine-5-carboxymethylaminomethyl(34) synthesis GTPase MnmE [Chloroflexia bacterium]
MYEDTIAAIATPPGEGGIGTIRLSGPSAASILARIFVPASGAILSPDDIESHKLVYGAVVDPHTHERVDEALVALMRAPHSYTCEDVVEVDCHGGVVPVQSVLALCLHEGARIAEPGEFTLRAFLNGRLDLAQAEAVLDVVQARTDEGLRLAVEQLGGGVSARVKGIRARLLHALAHLEATIDFPEDDVPPADVSPDLRDALDDLIALIASANTGIILRQGVRTAIIGKPNVGKSSLMNALLRTDRAIVTPIPGTTRDTLEEVVNVRGVPLVLTDTAGLRANEDTDDPIERIGMDRTRRALSESDMALLILDGSRMLEGEDLDLIEKMKAEAPPVWLAVVNKSDLDQKLNRHTLKQVLGDVEVVETSAVEPEGTTALEDRLASLALSGKATPRPGETVITSVRHRDALLRAHQLVESALAGSGRGVAAALVAVDIHAALNALGEITGETVGEDLLDEIFRNFCIGK